MSDTNLSLQLTSFIGREAELAQVTRLVSSSSVRLMTVTGTGGIGKTRFALEVGSALLESYSDGVWVIELAGRTDPSQVPKVVADTLELRSRSQQPVMTTLTSALRARQLLLILDNCEHLLEACARLAETLLRACPKLRIIATSREALGILGETVWPMAPLSVPDFWRWPAAAPDIGAALRRYEAVRLFVDRVEHYARGFAVTDQNAIAIAQICFGLDGLPLAIELAAARIKTMSLEQIATRLDDRFRLLTSGSRTALPRQQTLQAVIDWSYDLLSPQEQWAFQRLAVFANGWTLEAAEWVCAAPDSQIGSQVSGEVFELLTRLVSKSLVNVEERDGQVRYRLLQTIRDYARAKLSGAGEAQATQQRHQEFYLRFAEAAEPKLKAAEQRLWSARLEAEHDNLRVAWAWALDHDLDGAVRLAWALRNFWYRQGYMREAYEWSAQLLERAGDETPRASRVLALNLAGVVANWQFDHARARALFEQSLEISRALGDKPQVATALQGIGVAALGLDQPDAARHHLEQSLALFQSLGDEWRIANVLGGLCILAADQGDYPLARKLGEESLARYRQQGDQLATAQPLLNLGELARVQGDYAAAAAYYEQILALESKGNRAGALYNLGQILLRQGQYRRAQGLFLASLADYREQNNVEGVALFLAGLAGILAAAGKPLPAARILGAVERRRETLGTAIHAADRVDYDYHLAGIRASLSEADFAQALASGRGLTLDEAIELALSETATVGQEAPARPPARQVVAQPELVIQALGPTRVWRGRRELVSTDWRYAKAKELLFYLLCQPPQTKEQIGLALWPDASTIQLRNNLGVTIHYLRRALGNALWIQFDQDRYNFNRSLDCEFDLERFETSLAEASSLQGEEAIRCLGEAVSLYQGDFCADLTDGDWPSARREELRRRYLEALLRVGGLLFAAGRYAEAADPFRTAIAADGYLEQAHRELMRCYARQGERGQALRHYQAMVQLLRDHLGAPPAPETTALYEMLKKGEAI